ncbi:MAG TPA: N-acetylgalactosamine-6-sulfatase [Verrucomicrobiales bacterium]|nr:N-acetylgalactosamine-6-sulfatase [Verrucomicrobiales bacterium]
MMTRFLTATALGLTLTCFEADAQQLRRPNVVLIVADDLGYGDLGCYGQTRIRTPNIDQLAREGMRFTQFYAGSTVCAPSRATLFTGKHTGHATIRGNGDVPLAAGDFTLSEMFRSAGYRVDGIGKWGLGLRGTSGDPRAKGFNQWVGFLDQTDAHDYYPQAIDRYDSVSDFNDRVENLGRRYIQDVFNIAMGNSVRINSDFQFFLYLPFTIPHANPKLKEKGMQVPTDSPYTAEQWPQPEKNKAAMITRLDQSVGLLRASLEQHRVHQDTIIIFTSDNGPHDKGGVDPKFFKSSGPFRGIKRDLHEGGIRVPMIVWWPGVVEEGQVSDRVWAMWDLMPTLAEVAGAKVPKGLDGISMLPTWTGGKQTNQHDHLYWEFHERGFQQAVRVGDWKGLRLAQSEPIELYNLKSDPAEEHNVAGEQPDVVKRIEEIMKTARTESPRWPGQAGSDAQEQDKPAVPATLSAPPGPG